MKRWIAIGLGCAALLAACITINVYFPEAAVKELAQQIEDEVQRKAAGEPSPTPVAEPTPTPMAEPAAGAPESLLSWALSLGATTVYAAEDEVAAPEITNPAIRKIIDSRAARLKAVNDLKAAGVVGESNQALLVIRNLDAIQGLKERADAQKLIKDENADREQLFREIAAAKNVEIAQLPQIRTTYAEALRDNARPGDWIQLPDGSWTQK
ncbi:MAG TPA: DUF1318 domain-containing protein [Candidatus Sulfomarinibacteraceae bacterium]|nr:DUF1318 domain-containing protein [Candidatus Sulfomarinibacteraceae bacterium]